MPTLPDESVTDVPEVELIERGPFETADSVTVEEPMQRGPVVGTKAMVAVSVGLIVLAFAVMTRPGPEDRISEEPSQTTVAPNTTAAPVPSDPDGEDVEVVEPDRIPRFEPNLPEDLPGVISSFDERGSVIYIERNRSGPNETTMDLRPQAERPSTQLAVYGGQVIGIDADILIRGDLLVVEADASVIADTFNLTRLAPETDGGVLVVESERGEHTATWNSLGPRGSVSVEITWSLPSSSVEVLGVWGEELLVQRANEIWLLDQNGGTRSVGGGQFLAFDGENLARLVCDEVSVCSLAVGPPSDPDARTVELPEWLEAGPDDLWVPTVAISPDGDRLAMAGPNGGISSPLIVDLETGIATPLADGINRQAAMAWSPDGRWLAYVYTDDVMVWSLDAGRSWRVTVNRQLETLLWR